MMTKTAQIASLLDEIIATADRATLDRLERLIERLLAQVALKRRLYQYKATKRGAKL